MADRRQAAEELLRRQRIRASMVEWARACGFEPAPHHLYVIRHLEGVARGELRRLLIAAPPGSAKSTYASVLFPAWFLAQHPEAHIICASHTVELAERFARRTRNLIAEHSAALGIEHPRIHNPPAGGVLRRTAAFLLSAQAPRSLATGPTSSSSTTR